MQKKLKAKQAVIENDPSDFVVNEPIVAQLAGNKDHLQTKKQIELLRKQYGDSWLQNHGANMEQSTGTVPNEKPIAIVDTISEHFTEDIDDRVGTPKLSQIDTNKTSTPISCHMAQLESVASPISVTVIIAPLFLVLLHQFYVMF